MVFEKLESRYRLKGELVAKTPIHVGSGREETFGGVDLPILTMNGKPYVPGSSLKGVARSYAERVLRGIAPTHADDEEQPCVMCLVNQAFGTQMQASKVIFRDCVAEGSAKDYRTSIRINPKTKTAAEGALFSYEFVPAGACFPVEILAENLSDVELGILCVGLRQLVEGHASVGGGKSRGLGGAELKISKVEAISPIHYLYPDSEKGVEVLDWTTLESKGLAALRTKLGVEK